MPSTGDLVMFGVIALVIVVAVPFAVNATYTDATTVVEVAQNDTKTLDDQLELTADDVDSGGPNATVVLRDTASLSETTVTVNESETKQVSLSGATINVTTQSVEDNETAQFRVEYPRTFGWSDEAKTVHDNLGLILVAGGFIVIALTIGVALG